MGNYWARSNSSNCMATRWLTRSNNCKRNPVQIWVKPVRFEKTTIGAWSLIRVHFRNCPFNSSQSQRFRVSYRHLSRWFPTSIWWLTPGTAVAWRPSRESEHSLCSCDTRDERTRSESGFILSVLQDVSCKNSRWLSTNRKTISTV